jgi:hypothetical protein
MSHALRRFCLTPSDVRRLLDAELRRLLAGLSDSIPSCADTRLCRHCQLRNPAKRKAECPVGTQTQRITLNKQDVSCFDASKSSAFDIHLEETMNLSSPGSRESVLGLRLLILSTYRQIAARKVVAIVHAFSATLQFGRLLLVGCKVLVVRLELPNCLDAPCRQSLHFQIR